MEPSINRATLVLPAGEWNHERRLGGVTLDFDRRSRRRIALVSDEGMSFLLDLPDARHLRQGDGLVLKEGILEVLAAPESLLQLRCADAHALLRLAWHIGNRHIPAMLEGESILIRADHVLADMARRLGAVVVALEQPFDPEGGAYADVPTGGGHSHGHGHGQHHH
ncbi:MAG: urease accessory protein UreE [Alphaproteobacteria bacterium]|nr:urease accessory protein UreE [Alphaproteobacteria bacterium]MBU0798126.1 urease accessory protein UreE [Alphaproteobacteria bacterium]MBU0887057.1 urease accessory protein UreE [Alphaproteobacteria bacterium]MBU1814307.1 urease accessory protein UreE [Alphaproteobacteria bacterium]MBU2090038.1 urease accessory protein UreE [Alphaproteobacteria bacterium]